MENPLLTESVLPFGAPRFDLIKNEHYVPAFREALRQAKAEIDAIADNPDAPTFENTVEAMEYAGRALSRVAGIFYNLNEAETSDEMQAIAEEISPMMTEWSMYVSLNPKLFARVKAVWEGREGLCLEQDQKKLLEDSYKSFVRGGANLSDEDKALFAKWSEELALLSLSFQKNVLASTNAFVLNVTEEADLDGLPQYVVDGGAVA
ncbi:MAG: M3 family peptidase, partial [Bacteroidales bacterium]|nr:M3 family peptidase [Bacteroidales bacterium]